MRFTYDDFEEWLAHPITERFMMHLEESIEREKQHWINLSWNGVEADQNKLERLRGRADAYLRLREITFQELTEERE